MIEEQALQVVRQQIDKIDLSIQNLLNKRAQCAQRVAHIKFDNSEYNDLYRPEREAIVLKNIIARNDGPLPNKEMARLFREIMSACLATELPLGVAYLGPEGSFTQVAASKQFGGSVKLLSMSTIADVFHAVEVGKCIYGVVPVENSTEGMVSHTLDSFISSPLKINGEVTLPINHHLLSKETNLINVKIVYAHPQGFAQCRHWLNKYLSHSQLIAVSSNAEAAKCVAEGENRIAAIAADREAVLYGLSVLSSNIEDEVDNTTRFIVIGAHDVGTSGSDKTALLVSTKNRPGALQSLLTPLADSGISMTKIESRPSGRGVWEYVFFIDIEGHSQDEDVAEALEKLEQKSSMFRVLGSYPKAVM